MAATEPDDTLVMGLDDPRLVDAMDANSAHGLASLARYMGGEAYSGPDMTRYISPLPVDYFNGVQRARLPDDRDQLDAVIAETMARFEARDMPMLWWLDPTTTPATLGERLTAYGLETNPGPPAMAVEISALSAPVAIPGVSMAHVTDAAGAAEWARVATVGFDMPAEIIAPLTSFAAGSLTDPTLALYLGSRDAQAVATSMSYLRAGVAGIYTVATVPEARRLGIGAEMTRLALLDAGKAGYRAGILQASGMGVSVYRALGFQTVFNYLLYSWSPPGA